MPVALGFVLFALLFLLRFAPGLFDFLLIELREGLSSFFGQPFFLLGLLFPLLPSGLTRPFLFFRGDFVEGGPTFLQLFTQFLELAFSFCFLRGHTAQTDQRPVMPCR